MKKIVIFAGAMMMALLTTSCLQQHTTLSLNKDGSGTITESTALGAQMLAMMGAAGQGQDPLGEMLAQAKVKSAEAAKAMGEGVTVKEVNALNEGGQKGIVVVYAFADINKLKYVFGQALGDGPEEDDQTTPMDFSYENGALTLVNKTKKTEEGAAEKPAEEADPNQMAMAKQMLADMRISLTLEFPGGIAETNAEHVEGNKVTLMDMDMGKLVQNEAKFKEFMSKEPDSPADAKDILKGVDGIKIEGAEKLTIKLK